MSPEQLEKEAAEIGRQIVIKPIGENQEKYFFTGLEGFEFQWNQFAKLCHQNSKDKGFWDDKESLEQSALQHESDLRVFANNAIIGMELALIHSEISEALEGIRHGNPPSDHIPEFSAVEEELADVLIRIGDISAGRGWRVAEAVQAKLDFNATRAHKHGKAC